MPGLSPDSKEIIDLLSRLKAQTPDYPAEMLAARKTAFLKEAAAINLQIKGRGGDGGQAGGTGGSGAAAGGSTTASGIAFQAVIGFGLVAAVLIGTFFFNEQNRDSFDNTVAAIEEQTGEAILPITGVAPPTLTPVLTDTIPTVSTPEITEQLFNEVTVLDDMAELKKEEELKKEKKLNPGLHLGQAEGTPAAPGQGNPGNINQPDKPYRSGKPEKPDKPKKP